MIDHAQATINLINAAIRVADGTQIKMAFPLDDAELAGLKQLKRAVAEYRETKHAKPIGDDDSFHGCG